METLALTGPVVANYIGAMYGFFEMEDLYGLKAKRIDCKTALMFGDGISGTMNSYLDEWYREYLDYDSKLNAVTTDKERQKVEFEDRKKTTGNKESPDSRADKATVERIIEFKR